MNKNQSLNAKSYIGTSGFVEVDGDSSIFEFIKGLLVDDFKTLICTEGKETR